MGMTNWNGQIKITMGTSTWSWSKTKWLNPIFWGNAGLIKAMSGTGIPGKCLFFKCFKVFCFFGSTIICKKKNHNFKNGAMRGGKDPIYNLSRLAKLDPINPSSGVCFPAKNQVNKLWSLSREEASIPCTIIIGSDFESYSCSDNIAKVSSPLSNGWLALFSLSVCRLSPC